MEICEIELFVLQMPRTDSETPLGTVLVHIATESGCEGWGEGPLDRSRPAAVASRKGALASMLLGRSVFDIAELPSLDAMEPIGLLGAVEIACWDLVGRVAGQPLCRLFGGDYRPAMPIAVRLPMAGPQRTAEVSYALAEQGFHSQVVLASGAAEVDLATLSAIRARSGNQVRLRFDGGLCYDAETAREMSMKFEGMALDCFIDPIDAATCEPAAALAAQTSVPLALCRAMTAPADVLTAVRRRAAGSVILDLSRIGGLLAARKCAAVAEAGGVGAALSTESAGVSIAAALQLAASVPAFSGCNESAYQQLRDDILKRSLPTLDGAMAVPHGPGLGIEVDRAKVEKYQVA